MGQLLSEFETVSAVAGVVIARQVQRAFLTAAGQQANGGEEREGQSLHGAVLENKRELRRSIPTPRHLAYAPAARLAGRWLNLRVCLAFASAAFVVAWVSMLRVMRSLDG